jgi:hypothetical protein
VPPSRPPVGLPALEVGVFADVGHRREHFGERAAPGVQQRLLEDFPMFLLGAVIRRAARLLSSRTTASSTFRTMS